MSASPSVARAVFMARKMGPAANVADMQLDKNPGGTMVKTGFSPKPVLPDLLAHPTRFERVTFAFGGLRSRSFCRLPIDDRR
jgi:hypothetical protein